MLELENQAVAKIIASNLLPLHCQQQAFAFWFFLLFFVLA